MTQPRFGRVVVAIEPSALERSHGGQVFGPLRLRYEAPDGIAAWFPEEDWADFAVVLLSWWIEQVSALRGGAGAEARCGFMDGPLAFTVRSVDSETYRVRCVEETVAGEDPIEEWTASRAEFEASLWAAGRAALSECQRREWTGRDVDTLRAALQAAVPAPAG